MQNLWNPIENQVRRGDFSGATRALREASGSVTAPRDRIRLAELFRRCGQTAQALRALRPLIAVSGRTLEPALAVEYAHCLIRLGAPAEAELVLLPISDADVPLVNFARAAAAMKTWQYGKARDLMATHLSRHAEGKYPTLVAKVNLAQCLVATGESTAARSLLRSLLHDTSLGDYRLLHGNALEIALQHCERDRDWRTWDRCLEAASRRGSLFLDKWRVFGALSRQGLTDSTRDDLATLRERAARAGLSETVRQCDERLYLLTRDRELFLRLYFGTPYEAFRQELPFDRATLPEHYDWNVGETRLDLTRPTTLPVGKLKHRLLLALFSDFYRPQTMSTLFCRLFPKEFLNPITASARIYNLVHRTNEWLTQQGTGMAIRAGRHGYEMSGTGSVRLPRPAESSSRGDVFTTTIVSSIGTRPFKAREVCGLFGVSERTARRLLDLAVRARQVVRTGTARATRYTIAPR